MLKDLRHGVRMLRTWHTLLSQRDTFSKRSTII
jgi:hypothetical protein